MLKHNQFDYTINESNIACKTLSVILFMTKHDFCEKIYSELIKLLCRYDSVVDIYVDQLLTNRCILSSVVQSRKELDRVEKLYYILNTN